ncbi:MAG TPA: YtxH domain-containing protein [Candidatus Pacearchaeota archaeon]|nr:YtxH domain-containing protein [Candidatus Pacearchaeota archaeon]HOK94094.1 YtxH domain-containing protein [Candidatus Pacearchaeota archaeon]HPO75222.1 YtxH domain-containing protein [Candidatus Pacearchaeota archaeon]
MAEKPQKKDSGKKITAGLFAGAIAGLLAGILLAPKEGKETREEIKKRIEKNKFAKEVMKRLGKVGEVTKEKYNQVVDEVTDVYKRAKKVKDEDLKEIVDDIKSHWPEIAKKLKTPTKQAKKGK